MVASNIGGIPEQVDHGKTGYLAPVGDISAMADHVLALVEDPERWRRFSRRAREHVLEHFQLAPAIDRYEALYRRLAAGASHR